MYKIVAAVAVLVAVFLSPPAQGQGFTFPSSQKGDRVKVYKLKREAADYLANLRVGAYEATKLVKLVLDKLDLDLEGKTLKIEDNLAVRKVFMEDIAKAMADLEEAIVTATRKANKKLAEKALGVKDDAKKTDEKAPEVKDDAKGAKKSKKKK